MIYLVPTKRGLGIELWGTLDDLEILYEVIGKFWNTEDYLNLKGFENRDSLISGFSYEIRKAKDEARLSRSKSHFSLEEHNYFGTKFSWVHFLFTLSALKFNMLYKETNKLDIATILNLEYWLESAMESYDQKGASELKGFIDDGLHAANEYSYQYMKSIDIDYFNLGGGKTSFRKLPELLRRGVFFTKEYTEFKDYLQAEASKMKTDASKLEIEDERINYENLKW